MRTKRHYQSMWDELMESVERGVQEGGDRDLLLEWAYDEYADYLNDRL